MVTDKIRKYVLPNIPYLFIGWFCLKIGTAYRLAAGTGFGEKLLGLGQTIGAAFASFAPGLAPLDWFVGIVGAAGFRLLIYYKAKKAKLHSAISKMEGVRSESKGEGRDRRVVIYSTAPDAQTENTYGERRDRKSVV